MTLTSSDLPCRERGLMNHRTNSAPGRPLVHIGYHKTASTWFQKQVYPRVDGAACLPRPAIAEALLTPHALHFDPQDARRQLNAAAGDAGGRLLLCHEELSGHPDSGGHNGCLSKLVAERLRDTLPEAEIVVLVRHQLEMIASIYKQYVRVGGTHRPARYLYPARWRGGAFASPYKIPLFSFEHFAYDALVEHYRDLFGASRVHVFTYEAFREDPRGFLSGFVDRLGLAVDPDRPQLAAENVAYGSRVLQLARWLNRLTAANVADKRCFLDLFRSHKAFKRLMASLNRTPLAGRALDARSLLGEEVVADIDARYAGSNKRLMQMTGLALDRFGYPGVTALGVGQAAA